jgi:UDP-N-acetylglucosamine:LPS N-acetylglucosamine transferase
VSAGAVTLAELAAAGVPALVVPLASAALDHQVANARAFAEATGHAGRASATGTRTRSPRTSRR